MTLMTGTTTTSPRPSPSPPGETSKMLTFTATQDTVDDDGEGVRLTLGPTLPDHVTAVTPSETTVSIIDDDDPIVERLLRPARLHRRRGRFRHRHRQPQRRPRAHRRHPLRRDQQQRRRRRLLPLTPPASPSTPARREKSHYLQRNPGHHRRRRRERHPQLRRPSTTNGCRTAPTPTATVNIEDDDASGVTVNKASIEVDEQGSEHLHHRPRQPAHRTTSPSPSPSSTHPGTSGVTADKSQPDVHQHQLEHRPDNHRQRRPRRQPR